MPTFTVEIDHLPEEAVDVATVEDVARAVTAIIAQRPTLHALPDDEPVQIKRPDRRAWGRNLTLGDFRHGDVTAEAFGEDGPQREASIANYHGIEPVTKS